MRRGGYKPNLHSSGEFELDLAPLLAVMVKLVPVLLISSAFVQLSILETELPQVVKEAIERQNQETPEKKTEIAMDISRLEGFELKFTEEGQESTFKIPPTAKGEFDFPLLQQKLLEFKTKHPQVFRVEMNPAGDLAYNDIVKIMDEVRQPSAKTQFKFIDPKTKKEVSTPYMFPEVVFGNMMEGS